MFWGKTMFHFFPDTNTYEISYPDSLVSYLTKIKNTVPLYTNPHATSHQWKNHDSTITQSLLYSVESFSSRGAIVGTLQVLFMNVLG